MALQIIYCCPGDAMNYSNIAACTNNDPADRISLTAFFAALQTTPDYFPEEKASFGLGRIGMKFRQNLQRAN